MMTARFPDKQPKRYAPDGLRRDFGSLGEGGVRKALTLPLAKG